VLVTYGDRVVELSVEIEDYEPEVQTFEDRIEFVPEDPADAGLRMIFSFDDDGFCSPSALVRQRRSTSRTCAREGSGSFRGEGVGMWRSRPVLDARRQNDLCRLRDGRR
jgi:hypothetical protein